MALSADDYASQVKALLPYGPAWPRDTGTHTDLTANGLAQELARIDGRVDGLITEADPRSTVELLADWERVLALPDVCILAAGDQTAAQRRAALVSKLIQVGGQSAAYYIAIAAGLGYAITITEFSPYAVNDAVDSALYGLDWQFAWQVNAALHTVTYYAVNDPVCDPLAAWGNALLECVLTRIKPAHTLIIFAYT